MPEDLTPLEAALARVVPAPARLDRDALMYAAGRASAKRSRLWPVVAAGFAMLSLALGVHLASDKPRVVETPVYVREPSPVDIPYSGYDVDTSRFDELLRRTSPLGELPPPSAPTTANGAWSAPLRPTLERDLDLPPGALRDVGPRSGFSPNS
jgi:hypothetical protein